jgi:hypothetical protein
MRWLLFGFVLCANTSTLLAQSLVETTKAAFDQFIKDGYRIAELNSGPHEQNANRLKELQLVSAEYDANKNATTGRGKDFENARAKTVRQEELQCRMKQLKQPLIYTEPAKWLRPGVMSSFFTDRVESGKIYMLERLKVLQIIDENSVHTWVPVNRKRNEQRAEVIIPSTKGLYEGSEVAEIDSLFLCIGTEQYETVSGGVSTIPVFILCGPDLDKYIAKNVPQEDTRPGKGNKLYSEPVTFQREWADSTGKFRVTAKLQSVDDTEVTLTKEDGSTAKVKTNILSVPDRMFIEGYRKSLEPFTPRLKQPSLDYSGY